MKIGILTYQRAHNYGALLQAYALKRFLENQGHSVQFIDYWPEYHSEDYKLIPYFKMRSPLGKIKAILLIIIGWKRLKRRIKGYEEFMTKKLNLLTAPEFVIERELNKLNFDMVICGSDQIWRKSN